MAGHTKRQSPSYLPRPLGSGFESAQVVAPPLGMDFIALYVHGSCCAVAIAFDPFESTIDAASGPMDRGLNQLRIRDEKRDMSVGLFVASMCCVFRWPARGWLAGLAGSLSTLSR